jgi:TPR repeat protein
MPAGHCLFQSYFEIAARLGDADAQQELAFCYANGRGCKKDRKEAAKWYRAAVRSNKIALPLGCAKAKLFMFRSGRAGRE